MAAREFPESFKDPLYAEVDSRTEQKLGLPSGLLSAVRTRGERSNHSQTNELQTATVYQFIPATRKAILDKYGLDVTLSPENASEGAGLLLKEGLQRNKGDAALAVAEYVGGLDRKAWGTTTRNYVQRVVGAQPAAVRDAAPASTEELPSSTAGESTFQRVMARRGAAAPAASSAIANVFKAYESGQMTPEEAQAFEADVRDGKMMLPRGAALKTAAAAPAAPGGGPTMLPEAVARAYADGQMAPEERAALEDDIRAGLVQLPRVGAAAVPTAQEAAGGGYTAPVPAPATPGPTVGDRLLGAGEAALTTVTGATGGALGMALGAGNELAKQVLSGEFGTPEAAKAVEAAATSGAQALTYAPRTEQGQEQAEAVGGALQQLVPVAGLAPAMIPAGAARGAAPAVGAAASRVADFAGKNVTTLPRRALEALRKPAEEAATPTPGTKGSVGSAGTDLATQRRATAGELPVPVELTKGQATRDFAQLRFEQETSKDPGAGARLRERYAAQNQAILDNFDAWVDQTGAEAPSLRATGAAVDKALVEQVARDKAAIRGAYKTAEKAGELEQPVELGGLVTHLNESAPDAATAPLLDVARRRALQLGIATEGEGGVLVPQPVPLKVAETYRQAIGRATDYEATNVRQSTIIKGLVDEGTEGVGGNLYRQARAMRARYAQNYENRATISKLLDTKRGSADRMVAFEDVFDHAVLKGSLDDVRNLRRVLQRAGNDGTQAWRELQGSTVNWIREQATKGVATDSRGNPIVSPAGLNKAVRTLDVDGRLDFIFGKQGAQQLRDINDLSRVVFTSPPGAVNTSNTASVLLAALGEAGAWGGTTGLPVPVLSGLRQLSIAVKNRRIQQRVDEALSEAKATEARRKKVARAAPPPKTTFH